MIPQSATSINDYKLCPMLYNFRHVMRVRPIEKSETLRQGTNWHTCLEILETPGLSAAEAKAALIEAMNEAYAVCPPSIDLTTWEIERTIILYSALGWQWYWSKDKVKTVAREVQFDRQINSQYSRRGKLDRLIQRGDQTQVQLGEYKSTSKPIDSGSMYWAHLRLDSQIMLYLIEARAAQVAGLLEEYGIKATDPPISGVLYDVWHKPTIKPKKLTQADTKKFMASGEYFGEKFVVQMDDPGRVDVNDSGPVEVTFGAEPKTKKDGTTPPRPFAIRETPEMFGARLLHDICEQPEKYFARKDIARTDAELAKADKEFYGIARLADIATRRDLFFHNEHQCDALWRCAYHMICYYGVEVSVDNVPEGFRCLNKDNK